MNIKKNIPNFFTLCNLFCGCIAIVFAFEGNLVWSAYMVGFSCVFDFLDGLIARALNVNSEIGKQLDSLADMVSFGVVPGVIMFKMISYADPIHPFETPHSDTYSAMIGFVITIFSCIRLAKFNLDSRQTDSFIGLPTPANTIFIASFSLIAQPSFDGVKDVILNYNFLITVSIILSILLVFPLPLFALKFKNFSWTDNKVRYIFLALALALLIIFKFVGIPLIIILYIVLSVVNNLMSKRKMQS